MFRVAFGVVMVAILCFYGHLSSVPVQAQGPVLVIGRITDTPKKDFARFMVLAEYLKRQLGNRVAKVDVRFAKDNAQMKALLKAGEIHLVPETLFSAKQFVEAGVAVPMLLEWRDGVPEYHSVIFVRQDSGLTSLAQLAGRVMAFEDPGSTSAYQLPRTAFETAGMALQELAWPSTDRAKLPENVVGYVFTRNENAIVSAVAGGRVDGGALSNLEWDNTGSIMDIYRKELRIIHRSAVVPRSLIVASTTLSEALRESVSDILVMAHDDPEGVLAIRASRKANRYEPFGAERFNQYCAGLGR